MRFSSLGFFINQSHQAPSEHARNISHTPSISQKFFTKQYIVLVFSRGVNDTAGFFYGTPRQSQNNIGNCPRIRAVGDIVI
jgi:hypothetical protein